MKKPRKPFYKTLNDYRTFPRIFSILFILLLWNTVSWMMGLDSPTAEQAAFASTMVVTSAAMFKFYVTSKITTQDQTKENKDE